MRKYPHAQISGCMRNLFVDALLFYNLPGLQTPNDTYYRRVEVVKSFLPSSLQPERTDGQRVTVRRSQTIVAAHRLPRLVYQISRDLPLSLIHYVL